MAIWYFKNSKLITTMTKNYYNTTSLESTELLERTKRSKHYKQNVRKLLLRFHGQEVNMHNICPMYKKFFNEPLNLSTGKRILSTLKNEGFLVRTEKVLGPENALVWNHILNPELKPTNDI